MTNQKLHEYDAIVTRFPVGTRVVLTRDVDIYPTIYVHAGETGTVASHDHERTMILLDKHHAELDEWNNELEIWREWHADAVGPARD